MSHARPPRILSVALRVLMLTAYIMRGQEEPARPLALEEAVSLARSHNRELKQARLEIHKQKEAFSEAKTQLYPRFDTYFLASELLTPLDFTIRSATFGNFPATRPLPANDSNIHTPSRPLAITSLTSTHPLNRLLGRDLQAEFTVEMVPASLPEESSLPEARKIANEMRPEIKAETIKKERATLETKIEKTRYIPDISIQANYATTSNISFLPQNVGAVGVLLSLHPWDCV